MKPSVIVIFMILLFAVCIASAGTWYITPDSTGDAPTIQAGIDSAWSGGLGGFVIVASGTYYESGIQMRSRVIVESETGDPHDVTIDAQWNDTVMYCDSLEPRTVVHGLTFAHGSPPDPIGDGGGMSCRSGSPTISHCVFRNNVGSLGGGAHVSDGTPRFTYCVFKDNEAEKGSAVYCDSSGIVLQNCTFTGNESAYEGTAFCSGGSPHFKMCTFYGNAAAAGSGLYSAGVSSILVSQTIISHGEAGGAVACGPHAGIPSLSCCDIFGNAGGDWVGCVTEQYGVDGNFSACPSFCNADMGDFHLCDESPCLSGNHPDGYDCHQIGAQGQGCSCGPTRALTSTWGAIKSAYR